MKNVILYRLSTSSQSVDDTTFISLVWLILVCFCSTYSIDVGHFFLGFKEYCLPGFLPEILWDSTSIL